MRKSVLLTPRNGRSDTRLCSTNAAMDEDTPQESAGVDGTLWTDRYRPKRFTDLLGDEVRCCRFDCFCRFADLLSLQRVHRSALLWLKEWDQCVFKGASGAAAELKRERRKKRARDGKFDGAPEAVEGEQVSSRYI
jgi:chromosome transmission fidelity protein 18